MSGHTPGPWRVAGKQSGIIVAPDGRGTVQIGRVGDFRDAELLRFERDRWSADARLIAAAPELLESLMAMVRDFGSDQEDMDGADVIDRARAAIAKATGK